MDTDQLIRSLAADGVKVVTIASDILSVPRVAYIGIDNRAAGRLAGYLAGRFMGVGKTGKVALFAGSLSYRGMDDQNRPGDWQDNWDDGRRTPSLVRIPSQARCGAGCCVSPG